ncbi:MAG: bifunctional [glutamine synthetase] adenylyltransferase/[glutamine synthetase]-adenylyl-L-tyrosine phosphorylase [Rhodospirillales bacterium]|nr:bifunctional [glutamine synthetase] adenylyltransferase/[glutamine synthetase]-adenylyl-L-tyrosine phosphorylase [Rhodospirillales bacterium]MBT4006203.1 bifunctional [glutamine synthetase] adenylyltransferase/[glutamine synthetase]-adenylyl-L-tyrosine phosphorylase [Rhodospirillales bacterium]MBT5114384.1 bifunctional [glutamine synthetase] adenylyltransferase/[glutamine synthetase]-adenylyl-L-tyrosine phosphorylase [Rhodospirillales bacterium]MBT5672776.1 bifunctional [glutamine synthetase]
MTFLPDPQAMPKAAAPDRLEAGFATLDEIANSSSDEALGAALKDAIKDPRAHALLTAIFGNSPWLSRCVTFNPDFFLSILDHGPDHALESILAELATISGSKDDLMRQLRQARMRASLTIAIADIAGIWDTVAVTGGLSQFADAAVGVALRFLFQEAAKNGEIATKNTDKNTGTPELETGLFILGLGKLGALELNYSSDIDLIALYDPERIHYTGRQSPGQFYVRVVRDLVNILETRTRDGYVFRTDLRLRPDPGSTPLAVSVMAAENYYESTGQNWERAALIKSRVIAGDFKAGNQFLKTLEPFLWRKNLDFAAIADIHSIKRQINAQRGGETIAILGHNLKLGRGGIREIEFFAQTQQLIWGGRAPELRTRATCAALEQLTHEGRITEQARDQLVDAYDFLRRAEHRLQMVDDMQTHSLPKDETQLSHFATFMGFETDAFKETLLHHLGQVEHHYAKLFEESPTLAAPGNLVFTGGEDDPETLATLTDMGFVEGSGISEIIRTWHRGRYRATRSTRARELLTELGPGLLDAFSKTANPDAALRNFDAFLSALPAGVQLFSLLLANPTLLSLIAEIMGSAPRLASHLAVNPSLFDAVLTGDFYGPIEDKKALAARLSTMLEIARDFEDILDRSRRFANDHKFQVGMQILSGMLDGDAAGAALSDLADTLTQSLYALVSADMETKHGHFGTRDQKPNMCIVALGKLGGREITENSDLDLLFVYDDVTADHPGGEPSNGQDGEPSNGKRPLAPSQYYARMSQQLITAISAPTAEGKLYEVDMRLRPSGNGGPIASSLTAFNQYQAKSAWSWEHMALTRARVIAGPDELSAKINASIQEILTTKRDKTKLAIDVTDMRTRLARGHAPSSDWDVKYAPGGLIDVEFIAQFLLLAHGAEHPEILHQNITESFNRLAKFGYLETETANQLASAGKFWRTILGMIRFTFEGSFDEDAAPMGLKTALARACEMKDFEHLKHEMETTRTWVRETFITLVGNPETHSK